MIAPATGERPQAAALLDGLPPGEPVTVEILRRQAARKFSTLGTAQRETLVARAMEIAFPGEVGPTGPDRLSDGAVRKLPDVLQKWDTRVPLPPRLRSFLSDDRERAEYNARWMAGVVPGEIRISPSLEDPTRMRLQFDQEVDAESALRVASTLTQLLLHQASRRPA